MEINETLTYNDAKMRNDETPTEVQINFLGWIRLWLGLEGGKHIFIIHTFFEGAMILLSCDFC